MERQHLLLVLAIAAVVMLAQASTAPALSSADGASIRFIHASPDAPPVDVKLDGSDTFTDVGFGQITDYTEVSSGTYTVTLQAHSDGTPLLTESLVFADGDYTLAAADALAKLDLLKLEDDNSAPEPGQARGRLVHLVPGAPAVDVAIKDGPVVFSGIGFKEASGYEEIEAGTYELEIRVAGTGFVLGTAPLTVDANTVYTVFAIGALADPQFVQSIDKAYGPPCEPVEILSLTANSPVTLGETMTFTATVDGTPPFGYGWDFDSDGTYEIMPSPATLSSSSVDVATYTYGADGTYTATVTVANCMATGPYSDTRSLEVTVDPTPANTPPSISDLPDQFLPINTGADDAIDLWSHAQDAEDDDDDLTFTISNDPSDGAGVMIDGGRYIDIDPALDWTGETEVEIEVQDTGGLTDTDTFRVTIGRAVYLPLVAKHYRSSTVRPSEGHWEGDAPSVSFDVEGQQVCNFEMEVPFEYFRCHMDLPSCLDIVDDEFSYTAVDPWYGTYENAITGVFIDQHRAEGHYSLEFCENTVAFSPNEDDWEATEQ